MVKVEIRPSVPFRESPIDEGHDQPLEKVVLPQGNIETRFTKRYLAIEALKAAFNTAQTLRPDKYGHEEDKANALLDIAAAQAKISEDPIPMIKIATGLRIDSMDVLIRARASRIAAYAGDEKLAFELAEKASRPAIDGNPWPLRDTADVLAEKGKNPEIFLNRVAELADTYQAGRNEFAGLRADNFAWTAESMHRHKRDPKPWLEKADKTLQKAGKKESWAYQDLANAYAAIGDYTKAKSLAYSIVLDALEKTRNYRQGTLIQIAYKQAESGDIDKAVKTAYESDFITGIAIILMKKAYMQARKGEDPSETLAQALAMRKQIKPDLWVERDNAIAHSTAGRILAIAGKDPDFMFKIALQRTVQLRYPTEKSKAYKHLAMDMFASGKDVHEILALALSEEAKSESCTADYSIFGPMQVLDDILEAVAECGYYEYFSIIIDHLESYKQQQLNMSKGDRKTRNEINSHSDYWKVQFLIRMAKALGENSMTREGIASLPEKDILEIRNSKSPLVKKALAYFGKA